MCRPGSSKFMPNTISEHTFMLWKDCVQLGNLYIEMKKWWRRSHTKGICQDQPLRQGNQCCKQMSGCMNVYCKPNILYCWLASWPGVIFIYRYHWVFQSASSASHWCIDEFSASTYECNQSWPSFSCHDDLLGPGTKGAKPANTGNTPCLLSRTRVGLLATWRNLAFWATRYSARLCDSANPVKNRLPMVSTPKQLKAAITKRPPYYGLLSQ